MAIDLDKFVEKIKRCEYLEEDELKNLADYVSAATRRAAASHWRELVGTARHARGVGRPKTLGRAAP